TKFSAELDKARLQLAFAFIHENYVSLSGWDHCAEGDSEALPHSKREADVHVHIGPQLEIGVFNVQPHTDDPFGRVYEWIDDGDFTVELLLRISRSSYSHLLALFQQRQFFLVEFRPD